MVNAWRRLVGRSAKLPVAGKSSKALFVSDLRNWLRYVFHASCAVYERLREDGWRVAGELHNLCYSPPRESWSLSDPRWL